MLRQARLLCKIVGAVAIIGALNWGLIAVAQINLVDEILGPDPPRAGSTARWARRVSRSW